jgi:hypothetical protein
MKFAYADPPYLGCGRLYAKHHPEALIWDDPETHRHLIERLSDEWPDGWALSLNSPSLQALLAMCPVDVRVCVAVKTFVQMRPVSPQYAFEPVILRGGRRGKRANAPRDWCEWPAGIHRRPSIDGGLIGGKPRLFCRWVFNLLGAEQGDTLDDLFPGTGAVSAAWAEFTSAPSPLAPTPIEAWCAV